MTPEELKKERAKVCADVNYFGYGSLCPDEYPCDVCKRLIRKHQQSRTRGKK